MDRLCRYTFNDKQLQIAVEFLKYVFNRVDIAYHIDQHGVGKPVFLNFIFCKIFWNSKKAETLKKKFALLDFYRPNRRSEGPSKARNCYVDASKMVSFEKKPN